MHLVKERKFNNDNTVTLSLIGTFDTSEFVTSYLPDSCIGCPVGFRCNHDHDVENHVDCGANSPLDNTCRPDSCKLITFEDWLKDYFQRDNPALTLDELKQMFDANELHIWIRFGNVEIPALLDVYEGKLVAVWSALGHEDAMFEDSYGERWIAYRYDPDKYPETKSL